MYFSFSLLGVLVLSFVLTGCSGGEATTLDQGELKQYIEENPDSLTGSEDPTQMEGSGAVGE